MEQMREIRFLKLLFCFKKPEIINLDYLYVLIKDKPTLFVVWEIKNVWSVKLIPFNRRFYKPQNAIIISIPQEQHKITFKAANFWRKKSISLTLCAVQLNELATAQLIQGFRPLNKVSVSTPHISAIRKIESIKPFCVKPKNSVIKKIDRFNIQIQNINYQ